MRYVQTLLFIGGSLALGFCAFVYFNAAIYQAREDRDLERTLHLAGPNVPRAPEGLQVTRLEIPRIDLSVMVLEGVQAGTLGKGAGHIPGTAFPNDAGNVGIAAHRDSFFRKLRNIRTNDQVTLTTLQGSYQYAVDWTRVVEPTDVSVLSPSSDRILTLVTCYPFYYVGPAPQRFIVRAHRVITRF
ncbi:MAG: class D sortase [Bryobacteraceae bacterium]|jgi:sortase A